MVEKAGGHAVVTADVYLLDVGGFDVVLMNEAQHFAHGWVTERARRMRLDGDAGRGERPRLSEPADDCGGIEAAAFGLEEAERRLEDVVGCGPAERGEIDGDGAVLRGVAGLERLGHRAEIIAETSAFGGGDADGVG